MQFTTYGPVRGQGEIFSSIEATKNSLDADRRACRKAGGYSDRRIVAVVDGFLREIDSETSDITGFVWPSHGKSSGAVRVRK